MKTIVPVLCPLDLHRRTSFFICVTFVAVFPLLVATNAQANGRENTCERKVEVSPELSKNPKELKVSSSDGGSNDSMMKVNQDHRNKQSSETTGESSPALNRFLDDVLNARDDFKWIDQLVHNGNHQKDSEKSTRPGIKLREKRGYDRVYGRGNLPQFSPRANFDNDRPIKEGADSDDADAPSYGLNGKDAQPILLYDKGTSNDHRFKDWPKTKDLCSLSDWLNSNKNPEPESDQSRQQNKLVSVGFDDARLSSRNQRDGTKKEGEPSLESLKETILELKKSLNEGEKKRHENLNNVDGANVGGKGDSTENQRERKTRAGRTSGGRVRSEAESLNVKEREQAREARDEKNGHLKVWRSKRTEVNNDDGNPKLFHRAGFGELYLEPSNVKQFHERKRRSKGTPSDEKRHANEARDKNNLDDGEKKWIKQTKASSCEDADDSQKKEFPSNDLQGTSALERENKLTNNVVDRENSNISKEPREESKSTEGSRNYEQLDLTRGNLNAMENKLTKNEERGESPEGNSLRTFESMTNELRAGSSAETTGLSTDGRGELVGEIRTQKSVENEEEGNVGSGKGGQVIKVFEPQGRLYQNSERTKKVREAESDEGRRKMSQPLAEGKRSISDSGNINILLKSEKRNLLKLGNANGNANGNAFSDEQSPFVLNMFDMKKKMLMENEDKSGKSVAAVYNVKIAKTQVDTPVEREEDHRSNDIPFGSELPGFGKTKDKGELQGGTADAANDIRGTNAGENKYKNLIELSKGLARNSIDEGTENWLGVATGNRMGINIDEDAAQKSNQLDEKDNYQSEVERFNDYKEKGESTRNINYRADSKNEDNKGRNKKKYSEIFIMPDGMGDRIISDRYGDRRILQYMEYSNDDVEDADLNYSGKEEEENQRQFNAEKSDASAQRKGRSTKNDRKQAKVNILIKERIDKKYKTSGDRRTRNPGVIEYYDYDGDAEQQDREALLGRSEQGRGKNIYDDRGAVESDIRLENRQTGRTCIPPADKKNEHEEEVLKEETEKKKLNNKEPKQEFIGLDRSEEKNTTGETVNPNGSATLSATAKFAGEGGASSNQQSGSRLKGAIVEDEDKKGTASDPTKCAPNVDANFNPAGRDDFFQGIQSVEGKDKKIFANAEPLYDELKKIYDWNEADRKSRPRIKGDQRMYYGADDKLDSTDKMAEALKDQIEPSEIRGPAETSASSPNLLPLLLIYNGPGKSETGEKTYPIVSSDPLESSDTSNVSQSNYFALKSTDDMFKGGSEQNNNTVEKLRGPNAIGKLVEWQAQKVSGARNRAVPEKDAARWSLTDQRQYIGTDSRSPYRNRKYLEAQFPHGREHVQNIDRERETIISSRDLHESFVEPLDWIDEFDKDIRVRLSRSLKNVETNTIVRAKSNEAVHEKDVGNDSTETVPPTDSTSSKSLATQPSSDLEKLFANSERVKRQVPFSYNTFYDDINQHHRDSERMDFAKHSENAGAINNTLPFLNSYETVDKGHEKHSSLKDNHDEYDYVGGDAGDYDEPDRSADAKIERKQRNKKKLYDRKVKKRKGKSSKSKKSRRKRRRRRKHSNDSRAKKHASGKKHKKHTTKHTNHRNVKKSKSSQNDHRRESSGKEHNAEAKDASTTNPESAASKNRISSLLMTDNMDDESQMDSALHGELAGKIVQQIFDQVQKNEQLKVSLGPGLYHKHTVRDTLATDQSYRKTIDDDQIKHTEDLLNKIMLLVNRLIFDEVRKKTCMSLPPDLVEFLNWMLDVAPQKSALEQLPNLPLIHDEQPRDFPRDKFLFQTFPNQETEEEINELYKKIRLIKHLAKEYSELSGKDKEQIRSIQDFLAKQLDLLLEYIEAKEEAEKKGRLPPPIGAAKGKGGSILRYQIGISNASNRSYSTRPDTFSSLISTPRLLKLNNLNLLTNEGLLHDSIDAFHRGHRKIRSVGTYVAHNKKHRKRRKRRKKHAKGHESASPTDQSRHKDTVHKAVAQRRKREYLNEIFWDSVDSGYEEPLIYTSMDVPILALNGNGDSAPRSKESIGHTSRTEVRFQTRKEGNELKNGNTVNTDEVTKSDEDALKELASVQSPEKNENPLDKEERIIGKNRLEDEILLLNKRQAWKQENEQQLEEVAFGEDMRNAPKEKELFEKLTQIDKRKNDWKQSREKDNSVGDCATACRNSSCIFSDDEKLRMIEEKINVYADSS